MIESIVGCEVTQVSFGGTFIIRLSPSGDISIEGAMGIEVAGRAVGEDDTDARVARLVDLFGTRIQLAEILPTGDLRVRFSNQTVITVEAGSAYEAFDLNLPGSPSKVVGGAGGRLEVWD
ncbi:MAG: DUF6188 family protein [Rhodoglobus sp.]|nr:DUF6188 family protein [Rhodoglobus sp.]